MDTCPDPRSQPYGVWAFRQRGAVAVVAMAVAMVAGVAPARAEDEAVADARVPPRLSYTHGDVSFWRPGAGAWAPAQVNTPLAQGDLLYVGREGGLEIQIGARAFVRAAAGTHLGLDLQEPDFLQFRLTGGHAALDLREVPPGHTVELATPNAVATIERAGYYRAVVTDEATTLIARRGGQAMLTAASGETTAVAGGTQVVATGRDTVSLAMSPAPDLDAWDHWNYERTGVVLAARSAQYVPPGVYGAHELDRHGTWRMEAAYGPVWVPTGVPVGWAPYTTGSWIWDPYYGWTWVDTAPWGWAPYHYGRWVYVRGHWAWAPGPVVVRPVYAPALVAFFGVGVRGPLGWVALGWGEPLLPWWGRPGFIGTPWWAGWGGPRVVNRVVVQKSVVVKAEHVTVFQNVRVRNAVVAVDRDRFGHGPVRRARLSDRDLRTLRPVRGDLAVQPRAASLVAAAGPATRPPDRLLERRVVVTRRPVERATPVRPQAAGAPTESPARIVPAPPRSRALQESPRPRPQRQPSIERRAAPGVTQPALPRGEAAPQPPRARDVRRPRPAEAAPAVRPPEPSRGTAPAPAARPPGPPRRPEMSERQRPRPETRTQEPARREPDTAPGRALQAPALRTPAPARVQPPQQAPAPGSRWRGADDRQQLRSGSESIGRQPSPAIRQQRPGGGRQAGPALRQQRSSPLPTRQR